MKRISKIMVACDFSEYSIEALKYAAELAEDLKGISSLIVPMNFVSMRGAILDNNESFTMAKMTSEHWQPMGECIDHDLKIVPKLIRGYKNTKSNKSWLLSSAATRMVNALNKYVNTMKRGEPPTERREASKWLNPEIPDLKVTDAIKTNFKSKFKTKNILYFSKK